MYVYSKRVSEKEIYEEKEKEKEERDRKGRKRKRGIDLERNRVDCRT